MPRLINDPRYWELRAQESRLLADLMIDAGARLTMLAIADAYDSLADAAKRGNIAPDDGSR
jgi:hypothetical protein